jgi:hypothetical protein
MAENRLLRQRRETEADQYYTPGSNEWLAARLYGTGLPSSPEAVEAGNEDAAGFLLDMAPVTGEARSLSDAWAASGRGGNALLEGRFGDVANEYANIGYGLLGALPGAGIVARGTKRGAQWMDKNIPAGVNRLLDSVYPTDAKNTLSGSIGVPVKPMTGAEFDAMSKKLADDAKKRPLSDHYSYVDPETIGEMRTLPKRRISGPSDTPGRPRNPHEVYVYHGTTKDFEKFDPKLSPHEAVYLGDHPDVANYYSRYDDPKGSATPLNIPAYLDTRGFAEFDAQGKSVDAFEKFERLKHMGYRGAFLRNVADFADLNQPGKTMAKQNQYVTWTPGTLRSALSNKKLFSAAPYVAAPALAAQYYAQDE